MVRIFKYIGIAFVAIFVIGLLSAIFGDKKDVDVATVKSEDIRDNGAVVIEDEVKNWIYSESIDEMDDSKIRFATTISPDLLEFKFPYDGGAEASLVVREKSSKLNIYLTVSKGQFLTSLMGNKTVKVRFDDNKMEEYVIISPSDLSTTVVFISNEKKFLGKLKASKSIIIQAEFFQSVKNIKFNTEGLDW